MAKIINYFECPVEVGTTEDGNKLKKGIVGGTLTRVSAKLVDDEGNEEYVEVDTEDEHGYDVLDGLEALILEFYDPVNGDDYNNRSVWINKSKNKKKGDPLGNVLDTKPKIGYCYAIRGNWSPETEEYEERFWAKGIRSVGNRINFLNSEQTETQMVQGIFPIWHKESTTVGRRVYAATNTIAINAPLANDGGNWGAAFVNISNDILAANGLTPEDLARDADGACKRAVITFIGDTLDVKVDKNDNVKKMSIKKDGTVYIEILAASEEAEIPEASTGENTEAATAATGTDGFVPIPDDLADDELPFN